MLFAVSIGNSHIRLGVYDGTDWKALWLLKTVPHRTLDEFRILLTTLFQEASLTPPRNAIVASVVPGLTAVVSGAVRSLTRTEPLVVTVGLKSGLTVDIADATELGADLFANAVGAWHRFRTSCIVVDFGTALSFTAVDSNGRLRGVSIAPGVQSSLDSLVSATAQLPFVDLGSPGPAIGTDTASAIRSGLIYGYAGLSDGILSRMKAELPDPVHCIATGGFAELIVPFCTGIEELRPHHTLEGLLILYRLNS